jgi:hypothetical protein
MQVHVELKQEVHLWKDGSRSGEVISRDLDLSRRYLTNTNPA